MTSWPFSPTHSLTIHPMIYYLCFIPLSIFCILSPPLFRFLPIFPVKNPLSKKQQSSRHRSTDNEHALNKFHIGFSKPMPPGHCLMQRQYALYRLDFAAWHQDSMERNWRHNPLDTKWPSKTQYTYLNEKPSLYTTQWNIKSEQIREHIQAYEGITNRWLAYSSPANLFLPLQDFPYGTTGCTTR